MSESTHEWITKEQARNGSLASPFPEMPHQRAQSGFVYSVEVREVPATTGQTMQMPDGTSAVMGVPLRVLRSDLGGDEGTMVHPGTGEPVQVSLATWKGRDPETLIQVIFHSKRATET